MSMTKSLDPGVLANTLDKLFPEGGGVVGGACLGGARSGDTYLGGADTYLKPLVDYDTYLEPLVDHGSGTDSGAGPTAEELVIESRVAPLVGK